MALLPAVALVATGGMLARTAQVGDGVGNWAVIAGGVLVALGTLIAAAAIYLACQPRVSYRHGLLRLHLRFGPPIELPIELAEAFLLGQGPTFLPGRPGESTTSNVILRIAERAAEWERVEVQRLLGSWCGHYVTIRGTWCEPLDVAKVQRLNELLAEAHARRKQREVTA